MKYLSAFNVTIVTLLTSKIELVDKLYVYKNDEDEARKG